MLDQGIPLFVSLGILPVFLALLAVLQIPIDCVVAWRKPWGGSLAIGIRVEWLGAGVELKSRHCRWWWGKVSSTTSHNILRQLFSSSKKLVALGPHLPLISRQVVSLFHHPSVVSEAYGWIQMGWGDPVVTGQWIGVLASLPPPLARRIQLRFDRQGWRSRGWLRLRIPPIPLILRGIATGWGIWQTRRKETQTLEQSQPSAL